VVKIELAESDFFTDFLINSINFLTVPIFNEQYRFFPSDPADPIEFHRFSKKPAAFLNSAPNSMRSRQQRGRPCVVMQIEERESR
jgi:hypothetical protein